MPSRTHLTSVHLLPPVHPSNPSHQNLPPIYPSIPKTSTSKTATQLNAQLIKRARPPLYANPKRARFERLLDTILTEACFWGDQTRLDSCFVEVWSLEGVDFDTDVENFWAGGRQGMV